MPAPYDDRYQLPSWPPTAFNIDLWNGVFGSIADRLTAREALEASFESLIAQGTQASLDYIQATIAPQIASLQDAISTAQDQIDTIVNDGIAPDSSKLGGQVPAYYATAAALTAGLGGKVSTSRTINDKPLTANVTLAKGDIGLGNVDNTADADKPVSTPQALELAKRIPFFGTGAALPTSDIGPIWHADYAAIMTWDGIGYASVDVGESKFFAFNATPAGHLDENGAAVSRTTYAGLFRRIGTTYGSGDGSTTFNLPDSRAEWVRGFDAGRGVDAGRVFGTSQAQNMPRHKHQAPIAMSGTIQRWTGPGNADPFGTGDSFTANTEAAVGSGSSTSDSWSLTSDIYDASVSGQNIVRNVVRKICIKF